jgi:hypothetical protein
VRLCLGTPPTGPALILRLQATEISSLPTFLYLLCPVDQEDTFLEVCPTVSLRSLLLVGDASSVRREMCIMQHHGACISGRPVVTTCMTSFSYLYLVRCTQPITFSQPNRVSFSAPLLSSERTASFVHRTPRCIRWLPTPSKLNF